MGLFLSRFFQPAVVTGFKASQLSSPGFFNTRYQFDEADWKEVTFEAS